VGTMGSFSRLKWQGHEADHSPLSSAEVNVWSCTFTPQYIFVMCLIKHWMWLHGIVLG